ncbi:MAG: TerC family protein [Phycisphaerae bacterium]|jgi:tellurite resistance protein TerC|nr:TerC family protein [Phycisphaerae bacterium]
MEPTILFPLAGYWWLYAGFTLFVLAMLALDLGVFHRKAHEVSYREAATWSVVWVGMALLFNVALWLYASWRLPQLDPALIQAAGFADAQTAAREISFQFLTGYVVEKSLSIDNIFVIVMIFSYFAIPAKYQHRVLFYGIVGALVFRAIFIALGSWLMAIEWVVWIAGGFLVLTGIKMLFAPEKGLEPERNPIMRLMRRFVPITSEYDGQRFFTRLPAASATGQGAGILYATPLLVALVFIEFTDVVFAIDSVPAIFALTNEPLIVFTSNIFAILGLRALYFLLAGMVGTFHLLKFGLGLVLVFVGLKMVWLNHAFGGKFPILWSLGIIGGLISLSVILSLLFPRREAKAIAPSPRL